jgi:uncharacterized membrane protein YdbT with pleckstrin-like domain
VRDVPLPRKLLNDYESLALDLHPHWWFFAAPVAALTGSIVLALTALATLEGDVGRVVGWMLLAIIVGCVLWLLVRYVKWTTTNFAVTSHRLIYRSGVLTKQGVEIPLERVNNVNFHQSLFERIIAAGDLLIESAGADGRQRFTDIKHPERVQNLIHAQIEGKNDRRATSDVAPGRDLDVASQLERLAALRDRGVLTENEFQTQKHRLLG